MQLDGGGHLSHHITAKEVACSSWRNSPPERYTFGKAESNILKILWQDTMALSDIRGRSHDWVNRIFKSRDISSKTWVEAN